MESRADNSWLMALSNLPANAEWAEELHNLDINKEQDRDEIRRIINEDAPRGHAQALAAAYSSANV